MHERDKRARPPLFRRSDVYRLLGFGWYFALVLLLGGFGGQALDKALDTKPLFILLGIFLGSVAGFFGMYRMVRPYLRGNNRGKKPQ